MPDTTQKGQALARPDTTSLARGMSAYYVRITRAVRALDFSPDEFILLVAIIEVQAPWSAKALSEYTGIPKTTVLRKLRRGRQRGYLSQDDGGWSFHPDRLELTLGFIAETARIASGAQSGFSTEVIAAFLEPDVSASYAQKLSFSPLRP